MVPAPRARITPDHHPTTQPGLGDHDPRTPPRRTAARTPHTWITMHSQPLPTSTETVPITAPPAAARARRLRSPRHPHLRPTRDPHTLWRNRQTAWTTLPSPVLRAVLPKITTAPFHQRARRAAPLRVHRRPLRERLFPADTGPTPRARGNNPDARKLSTSATHATLRACG